MPSLEAVDSPAQQPGFTVELDVFTGPFEVLLGLIAKRRLDITDVALAQVTDEFLAFTRSLRDAEHASTTEGLEQLSSFLVVAATLLDLKTARLLPQGEMEDELDLELLEARDLLFARLLQYRAYKQVSLLFKEHMEHAGTRVARTPELEERFRSILPPLEFTAAPEVLAALYATAISRDHTPPTVSVDHLHLVHVSVAEQRSHILGELAQRDRVPFSDLAADAGSTLVVVARFLAVLELFKAALCELEQDTPLGALTIVRAAPVDRLQTVDLGASEQDGQ